MFRKKPVIVFILLYKATRTAIRSSVEV